MKTILVQSLLNLAASVVRPLALCAFGLALLGSPGDARSQTATNAPPDRLSYQGYLADANGNALAPITPVNYPVVFRIFAAASGGAPLWSEQQIVTVDKGNFSVVLGEGTQYLSESRPPLGTVLANNANASERYIGINVTISGTPTEILPRLRLLPTPYAFLSTSARNLTSATGGNVVTHTNNRVEVTGNLFASGTISGNGSGITSLSATALPQHFTGTRTFDGPVGIGNTSPGDLLQVGAFSSFANVYATIATVGGNQYRAGVKLRHNDGSWGWTLESDERDSSFRIMSHIQDPVGVTRLFMDRFSGNLGLGTTTPGFPLTFPDILGDKISLWGQSGDSFGFGIAPSTLQIHANSSASDIAFGYGSSGTMTESMRIKGGGNVGIGNSNPQKRLHIGTLGQAGTEAMIRLDSTAPNGVASRAWELGVPGGNDTSGVGYSFVIDDTGTAATEFIVRWDTGNVGIGTATPQDQLHLHGGALRIDDAAGAEYIRMYRSQNGLIISGNGMGNAGGVPSIQWDGDNNWDSLSDRRLKKDITDAEPVLERVMQLPVRRYRWKKQTEDEPKKFGVIAQEVQPLFPESVGIMNRPGEADALTVKYATFGLIAVKALQELKTQKDLQEATLQREMSGLKQEILQLKGQLEQAARADADGIAGLKQTLADLRSSEKIREARTAALEKLVSKLEQTVGVEAKGQAAARFEGDQPGGTSRRPE